MALKSFLSVATLWLLAMAAYGQRLAYTNHTEAGVLTGDLFPMSHTAFTFQTFHGIKLGQSMALGVTVGIDTYPHITVLPISLGWRGIWALGSVSPYLGLDMGYGTTWLKKRTSTHWHEGGFLFNPAIGISIKSKGKDRFTFSVGYKSQVTTSFEGVPMQGTGIGESAVATSLPPHLSSLTKDAYHFQRMSVRLGMVF